MNSLSHVRLVEILRTMDLPKQRVDQLDLSWLVRNIGVRNSEHPDFKEAVDLLRSMSRDMWVSGEHPTFIANKEIRIQ